MGLIVPEVLYSIPTVSASIYLNGSNSLRCTINQSGSIADI